jgi:beta-lactamase class A
LSSAVAGRGDIGVTVQEISGQGRRGGFNGSKEYVTASTYKLLLTLAISKKLDNGSWNWGTNIAGTRLDTCFDRMIVVSDNTCAAAFGEGVGWQSAEDQLKSIGLKNTFLNNHIGTATDKHSTSDDEELYLRKVATENILRKDLKDRLWDTGARQIFRSGIPAGSRGSKVVDKVGFYNGYLNDTAIVYGPKSTYSISIMTKNSSWGNIAYVAGQIYDYLNK